MTTPQGTADPGAMQQVIQGLVDLLLHAPDGSVPSSPASRLNYEQVRDGLAQVLRELSDDPSTGRPGYRHQRDVISDLEIKFPKVITTLDSVLSRLDSVESVLQGQMSQVSQSLDELNKRTVSLGKRRMPNYKSWTHKLRSWRKSLSRK